MRSVRHACERRWPGASAGPPVRCQRSLPDGPEPSDGDVSPPEPPWSGQSSRVGAAPFPFESCANGDCGALPEEPDASAGVPDDPPDASADAAQTAATTNTSPRSASAARGSNLDAVVLSMWFTSSRSWGSGKPAEPERGQPRGEEQEDGARACEGHGHLLLLLVPGDLGADRLVHRVQVLLGRCVEVRAAGLVRDLLQRLP